MISDLEQARLQGPSVVTIGAFEGLHLGHQDLIRSMVARAHDLDWKAGLVTFVPHPRAVLEGHEEGMYLLSLPEKIAFFEELGLDLVAVLPFTRELASMAAGAFIDATREALQMKELWAGPDFALGRGREGDAHELGRLGERLGFAVREVPACEVGGQPVSSTRIRDLITAGHVREAAALLGRPPVHRGVVVRGAGRGKGLGFPTANLSIDPKRVVPAAGVYAVLARVGEEEHLGVANVGTRPSFDNGEINIEVHLLDYEGDLYGRTLEVSFVDRLRDERRFGSAGELEAQIAADVERSRRALSELACATES